MKLENQPCSVCEGTVKLEKITYTQTIGNKVVMVAGVPAMVCGQCGEQYLSPETVDELQKLIEAGPPKAQIRRTIEVPIYNFPHA